MTINDVAKEMNLTRRAIKFYEEKGLLSVPKDENGYRRYDQEHIRILKAISVYCRLGVGIPDIQRIIIHGDETILQQVLRRKEDELQDRQEELAELRAFVSTHDVDRASEHLSYETVAKAIRDAIPGFYGRYFFRHFQPYLQITLETEAQKAAYQAIVAFWDQTTIRIPPLLKLTGWIMLHMQPQLSPEQLESRAAAALERWLDPGPEAYEKLKKTVLDGYKAKRRMRFHPLLIEQRRLMKELQNKGYNDIFIPQMKILSPAYKRYHDAFTAVNDRICAELGLYYDANFNLVRKEPAAR